MQKFKLVLISAGFEHGGNVTHRHLDGHPELLVYPFESQLGNRNFNDFLASIERVQYRYPEFPEGLRPDELYEQIIDEEMKTFLRKRNGSKFKDANLDLDEADRKEAFKKHLGTPAIGIDADRIVRDFPNVRIVHIIRNPFSAYRDTKRRPFPQPLSKYLITWNIYHSTVEMYAKMFPENVRIFRYEDLVGDKQSFMKGLSDFIGVEFSESMLYPSWNGEEIKDSIAPWGTVLKSTPEYNEAVIEDLSVEEKLHIKQATTALANHFDYDNVDYLKPFYGVK